MKITTYFPNGILCLLTFLFSSCGTKDCTGTTEDKITEDHSTVVQETQDPIIGIHMVIDKSGSMKGYFQEQAQLQKAIQSFLGLVAEEKSDIRFAGEKNVFKGSTTANILANTKFDKDTDMQALIKECIDIGGDSIPVALVTDGIVSTSQGKADIPQTERIITGLLKKKQNNLSWLIIRGVGKYNGSYYIENDRPKSYPNVTLNTQSRPFFIIVIGPKTQIRSINEEILNKKEKWEKDWKCEWLAFNPHDDHSNLKFYVADNTYFEELGDFYYKLNNSNSEGKIPLSAGIPSCLYDIVKSNKSLREHGAEVTINGTKITGWSSSFKDGKLTLEIPKDDLEINAGVGDTTLTLSFSANPTNTWINDYSSDDDSNIVTDIHEQKRTYQLKSLIEPMSEAAKNHEVRISFKYTTD